MLKAEEAGTIESNLKGIAMGNAWISPVDATLTWGPLLLAAGLVDQAGHDNIQANAREAERLFNAGLYRESSFQWGATQMAVFDATTRVDFYDILTKMVAPNNINDTRLSNEGNQNSIFCALILKDVGVCLSRISAKFYLYLINILSSKFG